MTDGLKVEVRGLAELNRAFRQVDREIPKQLKVAFRAIADEIARDAAGKVPRRSGKAAGSIKGKAREKGASIAFGGSAAPYFPWLNFGGSTGRGHGSGKGAITRDLVKPDRYIYATMEEHKDRTADAVDKAVESVVKTAGFEQRGSN